ncbi:LPS assembly lipoprotein LptE [Psychroflexus sp. CAK57W]|uniref:LptE family protein n=1 Tax=Psychroflexus curvus TaxID=2873595 RepID=UPI001CC92D1B|nr:LptE family protein [Psychroflexus curvus]MBZ9628188.1 LPS assembly lipoprotein LptE [Psychroflexus curvus]MBZ9788227.1 LPS assembly lipoprotein LptE [Psychroflexus curvus]
MKIKLLIAFLCMLSLQSCGYYSFTGADTGNAETFQVNYFQNNAQLVEPGIDRDFTLRLQDLIQNQTKLGLANNNADLIYEGEITRYYIAPMTSTADSRAAQNRLTIAVNVRYYNTLDPEKDFEQTFSFYYDYPANSLLTGALREEAIEEIFLRITQDVFNASLTNW